MKKLPCWTVKRRIQELSEFKTLIYLYFNNIKHDMFGKIIDNDDSQKTRSKINSSADKIATYLHQAGVSTYVNLNVPGFSDLHGDIFVNLFNYYQVNKDIKRMLIDFMEE